MVAGIGAKNAVTLTIWFSPINSGSWCRGNHTPVCMFSPLHLVHATANILSNQYTDGRQGRNPIRPADYELTLQNECSFVRGGASMPKIRLTQRCHSSAFCSAMQQIDERGPLFRCPWIFAKCRTTSNGCALERHDA